MNVSTRNLMLEWISNALLLYAGMIVAVSLYQRFDAWRIGGACPIPIQKPWTISAFVAVGLSAMIIYGLDYYKKRARG